jgi:hypothetical protein
MDVTRHQASDLPDYVTRWVNRNSLFGSVPFARLWETLGGRVVYWLVRENDKVLALLQGIEFGKSLWTRFQAMPDGLYGELHFLESGLGRATAYRLLLETLARQRYAKLFLNDFHRDLPAAPGFTLREVMTTLVDISSPGWQPPDKKLLSEIRKAEREGVELTRFSLSRHFDDFQALMEQTEERHGRSPKYPRAFYHSLAKLAMIDDRVIWQVAEHEGKMACSHIYLIEGEMILNWQIYFDKLFSFVKPNQYVMYSTAHEVHRRGVTTLNLGASPVDADSLAYYKKKWGGEPYRYQCLQQKSWLGRLV